MAKRGAKHLTVIDADSHVVERQELWDKYVEEPFWSKRPQMIKLGDDSDWFSLIDGTFGPPPHSFKGRYPFGGASLGLRHAGRGTGDPNPPLRLDVGSTGAHARLKDMDIEGRDIDILYPTVMLACNNPWFQDAKCVSAICRAYNSWLADFCKADAERLLGVAVVTLLDVEEAVKEVNRCVTQLGFVGVMVAPAFVREKNLDDPTLYPFYEEVERLGIPIGIHIALTANPPKLERTIHENFPLTFALVTIPHIIALGSLIFGGVLERFPGLRFVILESGVGWVPYWLERFDEKYISTYETWGPELKTLSRLPSEYIKSDQIFFSCDSNEVALPLAVEVLGEDRIVYASDYPHHDCRFPNSVKDILEHSKLTASAKQKILGENAARLYRLKR